MRQKLIAGNWKMNKNLAETTALIQELLAQMPATNQRVVIAPAFTNLAQATTLCQNTKIEVAAQNMHAAANGAYTGEISAAMLQGVGVNLVILGHSERRAYFNETASQLAEKVHTALQHQMEVIFCFGEELSDRKNNQHFAVVEQQIKDSLFALPAEAWKNIILAYEPVWAIGTGETASPEQAEEMHAFIRQLLANQYGNDLAEQVIILYGGSVKPDNAKEIFGKPNVDGGLIGGASLKASDFIAIIQGAA
ncbi:MAG: triose-phosphate isomerase [Flavobacteriales bacterium]|nr:triose-phosphate isomerase [Flavobacteriales bacterium]